jgi:hypothetical protein
VLGWEKYRDIALRYSLGVTEQLLMEAGQIARQPSRATSRRGRRSISPDSRIRGTPSDYPAIRFLGNRSWI